MASREGMPEPITAGSVSDLLSVRTWCVRLLALLVRVPGCVRLSVSPARQSCTSRAQWRAEKGCQRQSRQARASKRNALLSEKFWFTKKWLSSPVEGSGEGAAGPSSSFSSSPSASSAAGRPRDDAEVEMTIDEILFGSE
uniref:Uncharacterized protein n=1 Tax=Chromera velia CCMP2878 TaxID=1169474 RepID=A0A0G4I4T7_9ALVE|eukprot:Cvel_35921.t1-p1 / transcript=Cvel_35921.t1 / gene=Cvel_35921 / organism=Chromera_velia_CCMP2878 / gene_product=hypothetical protein / transcript_product=hypothetical protein / location=Cvel_scaffold6798:1703-2477(-) / protein_length=139 / sequence_SO=supercontig / SO=protein_coding / is_pseudo=false